MKQLIVILVLACVMFAAGLSLMIVATSCRPGSNSALHKAALQLKPGMNRTNVEELFSTFPHSKPEAFEGKLADIYVSQDPMVIYQTNLAYLIKQSYSGGKYTIMPMFEDCDIYFDTNDVIAGYRYTYDR